MANRIRIVTPSTSVGTVRYNGATFSRTTTNGGYAKCTDVTGQGGGQAFEVYKITSKSGGFLNGSNGKSGTSAYIASNLGAQLTVAYDALAAFHSSTALGLDTGGAYASKLLAMTNPSRADVDIPVFIAELKDLPSLVKDAGGRLIRVLARHHLRTHFGIMPLVRDLLKMCDFVAMTEARMKELNALKDKGLRRTRTLGTYSASTQSESNMNSDRGWVALNRPTTKVTSVRVWGHVKWFPAPGFPATNADLLHAARKAVLGLTIDAATAWELIPFSWLVDWFGSVGTYLASQRNIIPCTHSAPQIMQHWRSHTHVLMSAPVGFSSPDYDIKAERKTRSLPTASPFTAHMPFLSGRQLAVLGSLTILRLGKYSRYYEARQTPKG